jgi:hypothetical protein
MGSEDALVSQKKRFKQIIDKILDEHEDVLQRLADR